MKTKTAHLGDAQALYRVYRDSPDYFQMLGTEIPTAAEVELELGLALMDPRRHVELIEHGGQVVGVLDWKEAYPEPQDVTVNLLLLTPGQRGTGLGSRVMWDLESRLPPSTARLMASVLGENPAGARFWERLGYRFAVDARPVMTWYAKPLDPPTGEHPGSGPRTKEATDQATSALRGSAGERPLGLSPQALPLRVP
ncbi:hypothetical protein GCM10017783_19860 [Deinococcus piscis]|uniref:N-acetyltransferase domain-containing protein n=1 Tax=Deinococcus piscis TaxID=394230 RepID=A0ABQ3K8B4_9DEIO|nr:GNAT family N-acetyltransferase [Deinococcus piscis]GHG07316.1 hypothetical protein GCM10017783_19860 [Deinococcus piscis]